MTIRRIDAMRKNCKNDIPSNEEMAKLTGFKRWPPTKKDWADNQAAHERQMAEIKAEIEASPGLQRQVAEFDRSYDLARQLHQLRRRSRKTQAEIAAAIGTTQSAVARIESGRSLKIDTLYKYASACGFPNARLRIAAK